MQIICTGASGLVGFNAVEALLRRGHKVLAVFGSRRLPGAAGLEQISADLANQNEIERLVLDRFPDAVVNCAAVSSPSVVDANPEPARRLNVDLPEKLAQLANHVGARLIHLSTDMVFDGTRPPYVNTDIPAPYNLYGEMKLEAEKAVLRYAAPTSVVLRISHVCGRGLSQTRSFDEKLFQAFASGKKAFLPDNEIKRFLPVSHAAEVVAELLERPKLSGIYHYAGSESISRYDAGARICERFGLDPERFLEKAPCPEYADFSLDCENLLAKIKTPAANFDRILDEIRVPDNCAEWYENETGRKITRRYKL